MNQYLTFIKNKFNKNNLLIIITLYIALILFYPLFIKIYSALIVNKILIYFLRSITSDIIILIIVIAFILLVYKKIKFNYQISGNFLLLTILISSLYIYNRSNINWKFYTFFNNDKLYYADIFLLIPFCTLLLFVGNIIGLKAVNEENSIGFVPDEPLGDLGEDLYGREKFAKSLAEKIQATDSKSSLAIGIRSTMGPW